MSCVDDFSRLLDELGCLICCSTRVTLQTPLTSNIPPTFLDHGKNDPLILLAESELTYDELRRLGVKAKLHVLLGAFYAMMEIQRSRRPKMVPSADSYKKKRLTS